MLHYDVCGCSRQCSRVLHDMRGLSVHFMLDIDGTIYQTLDLKERTWHATTSNDRSIGIEIASISTTRRPRPTRSSPSGTPRMIAARSSVSATLGDGGIRTPNFIGRPVRPTLIQGRIQNSDLLMYDLTPQQYHSLRQLTRTLGAIFPKITMDYPRGEDGRLLTTKLPDDQLASYQGILGHYHIQENKTDPALPSSGTTSLAAPLNTRGEPQ